jgi:DNA-binding NarL/FixJ family response regulator
MIRTLIVDHHPALRAGVKVVLEAERDMVVVGDTGAYSAYADERLRVAARVAGADGLLDKNSSALDLVQAIRCVHSGRPLLEPIEPGDVQVAARSLDRQEAQILAMLLDGVPPTEIAVALSVPAATFRRRVTDILCRLCAEPPWNAADVRCDRPAA